MAGGPVRGNSVTYSQNHRTPHATDSKGDDMATTTETAREARVTGTNPSPSGMRDQGLTSGQAHEFAIILPLKPWGGQRMRDRLRDSLNADTQLMDRMGTLHDL